MARYAKGSGVRPRDTNGKQAQRRVPKKRENYGTNPVGNARRSLERLMADPVLYNDLDMNMTKPWDEDVWGNREECARTHDALVCAFDAAHKKAWEFERDRKQHKKTRSAKDTRLLDAMDTGLVACEMDYEFDRLFNFKNKNTNKPAILSKEEYNQHPQRLHPRGGGAWDSLRGGAGNLLFPKKKHIALNRSLIEAPKKKPKQIAESTEDLGFLKYKKKDVSEKWTA